MRGRVGIVNFLRVFVVLSPTKRRKAGTQYENAERAALFKGARGSVGAKKRRLRVQQSQRRVAGMAKAAAGDSYRRRRKRKRLAAVGWTHKKNRLGFLYTVRTTLYGVRAYTEPQTVSSLFSSPLFRIGEALFRRGNSISDAASLFLGFFFCCEGV